MDLADLVAAMSMLSRVLSCIVRDRLTHFLVGAGALFLVAPTLDRNHISLSGGYLETLHGAQARRLGVSHLSVEGADEVDRRAVEDEVLYREALRLGLDRDDGLMREHLIQKMLLMAEDLGGASREATRDELRAYFDRTRDRWRQAERVRLVHVFATRRELAEGLVEGVRAFDAAHPYTVPPMGEAFARSRDVRGGRVDYAATYGEAFAAAVFALTPGRWSAPIESRFGWHLVKVLEHAPGAPAAFDDVYEQVRLDYAVVHRHEAIAHLLKATFRRYHVDVDGVPVRGGEPTDRLALRAGPSQED